MKDMSESKHRQFLAEGLKALAEKKAAARAARFSDPAQKAPVVRRSVDDVNATANPYALRREQAAKLLPKVKARSVLAIMFLPQFHLSYKGFSHIYPVFIRMLALMLLQANLIPDTHPSLAYGAADVPKVGFNKLMGEAWFKLRTRRSTISQYGLFGVVMMAIAAMISTVGTFFARIFLGVGEVAQAQLFFTHPDDPYGAGAGQTSLGAVSTITPVTGIFDSRVTGNHISTDYALMVLDKILRQAAADTPSGGAVQNALAGMMKSYNAGVSIVAGVIIFWMVISIILDTAKTGVFGGGRHNMVWAPIRVIFALGLMFPLGTGFSSGQYMVMKFAEWGSNFGSRSWATYVAAVIGDQTLLMPFSAANATSLVNGLSKIMVCQVAYNTYVQASTGGQDADQVIMRVQDATPGNAYITNRYTNRTSSNVCGTIKYGTATTTTDDSSKYIAATGSTTPMTASTPIVSATDYNYTNTTLATAMNNFRNIMRAALESDMQDSANGALSSGGTVIEMARKFACQYTARRYADGGTTNLVNAVPQCAGSVATTPTAEPTGSDQQAMVDKLVTDMQTAYDGPGRAAMMAYISSPTGMVAEMKKRGWAGMGMWYQDISSMNGALAAAKEVPASFEAGTVWSDPTDGGFFRCMGSKLMGRACRISGLEEKVGNIMTDYDRWWATTSVPNAAGRTSQDANKQNQEMTENSNGSILSFMKSLLTATLGDNNIIFFMTRILFPRSSNVFIFDSIDVSATNTYPLAQLADTGHSVLGIGAFLWLAVSIFQSVSTISGAGFSLGSGFAVSAFVNLIGTIGSAMIMSGIMIAFYLPVLPFIRVAMSVLTWMCSVFEAVIMVPIAALSHLTSTGEGLAGQARTVWILWLNVLLRPVLVVMGFVGGMLLYNSFAVYFHTSFMQSASGVLSTSNYFVAIIGKVVYSVIYLATLYTAANTSFKLLDVLPNGLMRWMGGTPDTTMDKHHDGMLAAGSQVVRKLQPKFKAKEQSNDPNDPNSPAARAANMSDKSKKLTPAEQERAQQDKATAFQRMTKDDKATYSKLTGDDQDKFAAQKFLEQENKRFVRMPGEANADGTGGLAEILKNRFT
ncbi:MAG: DotA/TraY family protein [Micavibrio sp.]|nr:DotA/TraY family protein [Micavibrio sp.]